MSALPVAQYLKDLGGEAVRGRSGKSSSELAGEAAIGADAVARMAEAYARGLAEGKAAANAEFDEKLAQERTSAEARLAAERQRWVALEGSRLADLIASAVGEIEGRIGDHVAQVLKPVLAAEVQRRAVAELAGTLESLMANGDFVKLTISGPEDLLGMLSTKLNVKIGNVTFTPAPGCDLHITADQTVLETQIGAWVRAIRGETP
jgi:hypothetical protein